VNHFRIVLIAILVAVVAVAPVRADTLGTVLERGLVRCGAIEGHKGFSQKSPDGFWAGFDVDICRAVSAAIFTEGSRVEFIEYSGVNRIAPLQSGEVDLMSRSSYWTMTNDTQFDVENVGMSYIDGQAIMVRESIGVASAIQLNDVAVCALMGSLEAQRIERFFFENQVRYSEQYYEDPADLRVAYKANLCDVVTAPESMLQAMLIEDLISIEHRILPERLSSEPWGPVVRAGDDRWQNLIRWTLFALLNAEELGITSQNVDAMLESNNPKVRRLLGLDGSFGAPLGVPDTWARSIIREVGNYGEIFDRNLGRSSGLNIARAQNELWTRGGLMYAPPIR
jgi:general L-amino acid transport system substrate-binding protein